MVRRRGVKRIFNSKCRKRTSIGPLLEVGMWKNRGPLWHEAGFQAKINIWEILRVSVPFWKRGCPNFWKEMKGSGQFWKDTGQKPADVAQSACSSQNVQTTSFSEIRCRKSAPHCGAKHMSKSKCIKRSIVRPFSICWPASFSLCRGYLVKSFFFSIHGSVGNCVVVKALQHQGEIATTLVDIARCIPKCFIRKNGHYTIRWTILIRLEDLRCKCFCGLIHHDFVWEWKPIVHSDFLVSRKCMHENAIRVWGFNINFWYAFRL